MFKISIRPRINRQVRKILGIKNRQMIAYHRYALNIFRKKPSFIVIGAQKAGTTSLHSYLSQNPYLAPSIVKETNFFNMHYERGLQYYKSLFPITFNHKISYESTPSYLDHPIAPKLCHQFLPNVKLIVLLREPVSRAYSHFSFNQGYIKNEKKISFKEGLNLEEKRIKHAFEKLEYDFYDSAQLFSLYGYRRKGYYAIHIKNWLKYYKIHQFCFLEFQDFINDPNLCIKKICDFVEIPFRPIKGTKVKNKTRYSIPIKKDTYENLKAHYKEYNESLFQLIGMRFDW